MHGATAFAWQKELRYEELKRRATMTGGVRIIHQSSDLSQGFELDAENVAADLEDAAPQTTSTTKPSNESARLKVKHVMAQDSVVFTSKDLRFESHEIDYDPNTHVLIARGTDRTPAELFDDRGLAKGTFLEMTYNLQTGQHSFKNLRFKAAP
jgi:hypothetical protein